MTDSDIANLGISVFAAGAAVGFGVSILSGLVFTAMRLVRDAWNGDDKG